MSGKVKTNITTKTAAVRTGGMLLLLSLAASGCTSSIESNFLGQDGRNGSVVLAGSVSAITGTATPFIGLIAQRQEHNLFDTLFFPSAYAAPCGTVTAYLFSIDSAGSVSEIPAASVVLTSNDASFTINSLSNVSLSGSTVDYILEVSGCNMVTRRPLTNPSSQEVNWRSSLISYIVNTNQPEKMAESDRGAVADYLAAISGATMQAVYANITGSVPLTNGFQTVFGFPIVDLQEASPKTLDIVAPTSISEGVPSNYSASFDHWNPAYTTAYLWKLDSANVSTIQSYSYTPGLNDQGTHTVQLFVGKDDGGGNIDLTKPYFTKSYTVTVNNTELPSPPALSMVSPASTTTTTGNITVGIATGAASGGSYAGCESFAANTTDNVMAITVDSATAPSPASFNITCNAGPTKNHNVTLSTAGTHTIRLWARDSAGVISPTPSTLTVNYSPPTQLAFTTQPSATGTICSTLAQQPVVAVKDPLNNTVTSSAAAITLAAYSDATCTTPATGVSVTAAVNPRTAVNGVATFTSVQLVSTVGAATVYLRASSGSLTSACSSAVVLGAGTTTMVWDTAPSSAALIATNLTTQPVVKFADACNNTVTTASANVTLGAFTNNTCTTAAGGTLAVTTNPLATVNGVATFAGVNYNAAANIYLGASAGGYTTLCRALAVSAGGAHQLAFTTAPSATGTAGTNLATQPRVSIQDAGGNNVNAGVNSITLATFSDSSCTSAVASGLAATTNPLAATAGHAQFAGVRMTTAGTYYLRAATGGLVSACAGPITISPAAASQLAFSTQPSATGTAGTDLAQQPVVQVRDAYGNKVSSASHSITLAAFTNAACTTAATGTFTVSGGNPTSATSGEAAFGGVSYTKAENLYIQASAGGLTSGCSSVVAVGAAAASKLAFTVSPGNGTVCTAWVTQPRVEIRDQFDNLVSSATDSVAIEIHSNGTCTSQVAAPAEWTNAGANSNPRNAVAGVANWAGTSSYVRRPGGGTTYLKATAAGLASACSGSFSTTGTVPVSMAFSTQPSATATAGQTFAQQPQVEVLDKCGDRIPSNNSSVTLSMSADSNCLSNDIGTFTATTNPVTASSGVATFSGVSHSRAGTFYLKANQTGSTTIKGCSNAIAITNNAANRLSFVILPKSAQLNSGFLPQPVVGVTDQYGNVSTAASDTITIAAFSDSTCTIPAPGTLTVTTNPLATTSGTSVFSGVKYNRSGNIWLKATSAGGNAAVCSGPVTINEVAELAAGGTGGCYRRATGSVYCWGSQYVGGTTGARPVAIRTKQQTGKATAIGVGNTHQCMVRDDGALLCWGAGANYTIGDGTASNRVNPTLVSGGFTDWVQVVGGTNYGACGLRANGTVWCWGKNDSGEVGNGTSATPQSTPQQVTGITNAASIAMGSSHACAVLRDGTARCWGTQSHGQLCNGVSGGLSSTPVNVLGLSNIVQAAASTYNSYFLLADGRVFGCGNDSIGELGTAAISTTTNVPIEVTLSGPAVDIAANNRHAFAVLESGDVYGWGYNESGASSPDVANHQYLPIQISGLKNPYTVKASSYGGYAVMRDGTLRSWGRNLSSALGDGDVGGYSRPVRTTYLTSHGGTITKIRGGKAATYPHTGCAVYADNTLRCWGFNNQCQIGNGSAARTIVIEPTLVTGVSNVADVAIGNTVVCALLNDGTMRCWGRNAEGQLGIGTNIISCTPQNPGLTNIISMDTGGDTTCAVVDDGTASDGKGQIYCWGDDSSGQLGNGLPLAGVNAPTLVSGITDAKQVSVGQGFVCAIVDNGAAADTVKCWGKDQFGQLGDDALTADTNVPVDVAGLTDPVQLVATELSACARLSTGEIACWGRGTEGQMGHGTTSGNPTPGLVSGINTAVDLVGGSRHFCAKLADTSARCWGAGSWGSNGSGFASNVYSPITPSNLESNVSILAGISYASMALKTDGTMWSWGYSYYNITQTPNGYVQANASRPMITPPTVGSGDGFTCQVQFDGTIKCWGSNAYGQLGNGTTTDSTTPVTVTGITTADTIAVGAHHACALLYDGEVKCWGRNSDGQLGDNTTTDRTTPVTVGLIGSTGAYITAGRAHTCVMLEGTALNVRCWGDNAYGQLGDNTFVDKLQPAGTSVIALMGSNLGTHFLTLFAGADHTCATILAGGVVCWGRNDFNQLGDRTTTNRNRAVFVEGIEAASQGFSGPLSHHTCIVTADATGRVYCWGDNTTAQLGNGTTAATTVPVELRNGTSPYTDAMWGSAGQAHTCASFADGTAKCWGSNASGRLGDNSTTDRTTPVTVTGFTDASQMAIGAAHSCACTSTGAVKCWGSNTVGQLGNNSTTDSSTIVDVAF